jgi:hypothetical protein
MNEIHNQQVNPGNDLSFAGQKFVGILSWSTTVVSWNTEKIMQSDQLSKGTLWVVAQLVQECSGILGL